jgi:SAM-dependent methyltransferase
MTLATCTAPVLPAWAAAMLACPHCNRGLHCRAAMLHCPACGDVGRYQAGIACFDVPASDASIAWYHAADGTHFHERMQVPYTMSALDAPVYHALIRDSAPPQLSRVILDLGAGDGRNTEPLLAAGYEMVIAVDAVASSLSRLRARLETEHPEWLPHLLLVQCDIRHVPLKSASVDLIVAIETLYYLNEDYAAGLAECRRLLRGNGRLLTSERSWEGALLTHLLYGGVGEMCRLRDSRDVWDGDAADRVRSRAFTEPELLFALRDAGFRPIHSKGLSVLALVLGYLRGNDRLSEADAAHLPDVRACLQMLADQGSMRRTHVVLAEVTTD